jgi:hypothetical protein
MKWMRSLGRAERDSAMADENDVKLDYMADRIAARLKGQTTCCPRPWGSSRRAARGCRATAARTCNTRRSRRRGSTAARGRTSRDPVGPDPGRAGGPGHARRRSPKPPWPTGCFSLRYRLANNGNNHDEIRITWFLDDEELDTKIWGSEIYNLDNTIIGDGLLPIPLAMGQHCCVGGNNRLRARISHTGNNNQIENIRLFVHHGKA